MIKAVRYLAIATVALAVVAGIVSGNTYKIIPDDAWEHEKFNWVIMLA
ncbi:hypothetical protein [Gorillibacterium sp. sgz500922]